MNQPNNMPFKTEIEYFVPNVWHWKLVMQDGRIYVGHASSMEYCTDQISEQVERHERDRRRALSGAMAI